ncbi:hypothetical protein PRUPE_4G150000 [Prunus persica]|uniref:Uncharacterized protein n=1 Tax=Prunus persica TaxID=3760 RepID=A0A251PKU3_PRUPE|nr:hypothetical protein PRUPE_4G150000 [Prunus persica]ONI12195.1 hypothetical protein PRUPE_4G150000 [Prunus persica]
MELDCSLQEGGHFALANWPYSHMLMCFLFFILNKYHKVSPHSKDEINPRSGFGLSLATKYF